MGYLNKSVDENGRTMFTTAKEVNGRPVTEVELTGSYAILKGDPFPTDAQEGNDLIEYDTSTGESKVYMYISGDWRAL